MKSRYFTLASLFTLLIISILHYKNKNNHSHLFDIQVVDAIHTPKLNSLFEKADAAKYAQDYRKADSAFRQLLSKKLSATDSLYIFNQLAYIHLMMNEDSIAHQWIQFYEKTTLTSSTKSSSDSMTAQADYNYNVGTWAYHTFKPKMAEKYLIQALKDYKSIYGGQHLRVAQCLTQLGMMHYEFNQVQGLNSNYLTDAYDIFQTNKELKKYSAPAELGMGLINFMMRNHEIAQANCENAIYLASNSISKDSILLARATSYRGQMLKKKAEVVKDSLFKTVLIDSAELDFRKGINILKGKNTPHIQELYRNIAVLYCYTKDSTKFWHCIDTLNSLVQKQGNYYSYTERLKGYFYYFKEENTKTVSQYKLFLDKYSTDSLCSTALLDEAYWVIIDNFNNLRLYDSSIAYNLRLMQSNGAKKLDINHLLSNPSEVNNENAFIPLSFLGYSLLHKYETNQDINVLKQAVRAYRLADSCMFSRTSFDEENTAIRFQIDVGKELYNNGLRSVYELYSKTGDTSLLNIAFLFIERMKSSILFRDINMQANDDSIRLLKSQFDQLLGEREVSKHSNYELSDKLTHISRLLNIKFKNPIQNQTQGLPVIQDVLNVLDKEQTIAFYFYGQPSYALYINHKSTIFKQITSDNLSFNIEKYRTCLSNTTLNHIKNQEADFKEASCFLYNQLIKPFEKSLTDQKELIIIPDAELHNIPFESFLIHKNWTSFKNAPFFIKNNNITISYAPSWKIFNRAQSLPSIFDYKTLCFSYGENASDLICSQKEIDSMTTALGKENVINFTNNDCVKERFLTEWQHKNYSILHLSLHAKGSLTNQFDNKIWFKPNKQDYLYGFELSGRKSSIQLVVLSACETGLGSVTSGEGAYSMARSFFQSGAKTVLATLWKVEDCQNAIIIQYFYTFLKKGQKPKQAICEAKRLFLKNAIKDELMSHPKFWAGVVCLE